MLLATLHEAWIDSDVSITAIQLDEGGGAHSHRGSEPVRWREAPRSRRCRCAAVSPLADRQLLGVLYEHTARTMDTERLTVHLLTWCQTGVPLYIYDT